MNSNELQIFGLSDYIEIYAVALGYSSITPLSIDADENGINDADEDLDSDGLIICVNIDETTIPLDTTYDPITRRLSADFLNDGIYFVMNVPQWFESVGIDPNEVVRDLESTNLNESKLENFASYSSRNRMLVNNDAVDNNDVSIAGKKVSGQVEYNNMYVIYYIDCFWISLC